MIVMYEDIGDGVSTNPLSIFDTSSLVTQGAIIGQGAREPGSQAVMICVYLLVSMIH